MPSDRSPTGGPCCRVSSQAAVKVGVLTVPTTNPSGSTPFLVTGALNSGCMVSVINLLAYVHLDQGVLSMVSAINLLAYVHLDQGVLSTGAVAAGMQFLQAWMQASQDAA